ncbi:hypothetical protein Tcan_10738 [Toxocara canis]|uniref:Uncharacterized protein n=2 Tax=Toxocara canis TaxID=6265 RepID=A0A0B2V941_TOXCA|nr:hypothetical protein Tcan_10738 [Toxocara canis]VDM27670.1 unnamed protein product [Toxocara canis]
MFHLVGGANITGVSECDPRNPAVSTRGDGKDSEQYPTVATRVKPTVSAGCLVSSEKLVNYMESSPEAHRFSGKPCLQ